MSDIIKMGERMRLVIKKKGTVVKAVKLSDDSVKVKELIEQGLIRKLDSDTYEIFSLEAKDGEGEIAKKGDYIKFSSDGIPYPNDAYFFEKNHRHIAGDEYEQIPKVLKAWTVQDEMNEYIEFLIREKGLELREDDYEKYFNAFLWGAPLSAAKDSVLIFYSIKRDIDGNIFDADFNFITRDEFEKTYDEITE